MALLADDDDKLCFLLNKNEKINMLYRIQLAPVVTWIFVSRSQVSLIKTINIFWVNNLYIDNWWRPWLGNIFI